MPLAKSLSSCARALAWGCVAVAASTSFSAAHAQARVEWSLPSESGGGKLFACDAGLLHAPFSEPACRFRETDVSCRPDQEGSTFSVAGLLGAGVRTIDGTPVTAESEGRHRCACLSDAAHRGDFLRYTLANFEDDGTLAPSDESGVVASSERGGVLSRELSQQSSGRMGSSFATPLSEVTFELGSEAFGAQYFIDLCYVGVAPRKKEIPRPGQGQGTPPPKFDLPDFSSSAYLFATNPGVDVGSSRPGDKALFYTNLAGIKGNWDLACNFFDASKSPPDVLLDYEKLGITDAGRRAVPGNLGSAVGMYLQPPAEADGWVGRLNGEFARGGDFTALDTQLRYLFGSSSSALELSLGTQGRTPRACRIRLYFWEAASGRAREWQRGGARFTFKWNMTEKRK